MEFVSVGFSSILHPKNECPYTGKEKIIKCKDKQIQCYADKFGSFRYILYINDIAVSALQIVSRSGISEAANVITLLNERRKGYAERVFKEAVKHHPNLIFSNNRSDDGKKYVKRCENILVV